MTEDCNQEIFIPRLIQAAEALHDAQVLLDYGGSARSVINRSFAAALYAVHGVLGLNSVSVFEPLRAVNVFDEAFVKTDIFPREISEALHTLHDACHDCDYAFTRKASREDAESSVMLAERVVRAVDAFR